MRFYTEFGQKLIAPLNEITADGFVYRIDMRLRPLGERAPLVIDVESFKHYLINHARDWERYAHIKADILHPSVRHTHMLKQIIHQFVYRHYHDYRMPNAIRDMKQKLLLEMKQAILKDNIKLGRGGIREIEFICQCYQLIYGGRNITLQSYKLAVALKALQKSRIFPAATAQALYKHYVFLRNIENALQMLDDQQTHQLPDTGVTQKAIANLINFDDWQMLLNEINQIRAQVIQLFDELTRFNSTAPSTSENLTISTFKNDLLANINTAEDQQQALFTFFKDHNIPDEVLPEIKHLISVTLQTHTHF